MRIKFSVAVEVTRKPAEDVETALIATTERAATTRLGFGPNDPDADDKGDRR